MLDNTGCFKRLAREISPQEFIKQWARYSKGIGETPLRTTDEDQELQVLIDVSWQHLDGSELFGLPHDVRRRTPGYIQPGDRVFIWGHPPIYRSYKIVKLLSDILRFSPQEWFSAPGPSREYWVPEMDSYVGRFSKVSHLDSSSRGPTFAYLETGGIAQACAFYLDNMALDMETHNQRMNLPDVAEHWELLTRKLKLNSAIEPRSSDGFYER